MRRRLISELPPFHLRYNGTTHYEFGANIAHPLFLPFLEDLQLRALIAIVSLLDYLCHTLCQHLVYLCAIQI